MPQGSNDTLISWGTMDANGTTWHNQVLACLKELKNSGINGVQSILDKYGIVSVDWGTPGVKIKKSDGSGFIG